ncbi:Protein of unknown function [Nonomuraea wenchangensis]|uniref:DUF3618 domain-containing protein n=2 Tax=Nonomuraea wenchangensis TaxID=568860 RepID=A0A1I0BSN3_9ACTN|nr:Protein of unknown function [Nonomuraea wenchangensis]
MGTRPEEMRSEIAATRAELAADVDRLADRTSPSRIARRRTEGVRRAARTFRERVMGTPAHAADRAHQGADTVAHGAHQAAQTVREGSQQAAESVRHGAHQAAEAVRAAPEQARRGTQGNPLAAGLIAFGAGLLAAALIPRTQAEEQAVGQLREQVGDVLEPVREAGMESVRQLGQEAREVAGQAAHQVRETAAEAAGDTAQHAREQARQVTDHR